MGLLLQLKSKNINQLFCNITENSFLNTIFSLVIANSIVTILACN